MIPSNEIDGAISFHIQAVTGSYVSQTFDPDSAEFNLSFAAMLSTSHTPTVIYLNEKLHYPNGFTVRYNHIGISSYTKSFATSE